MDDRYDYCRFFEALCLVLGLGCIAFAAAYNSLTDYIARQITAEMKQAMTAGQLSPAPISATKHRAKLEKQRFPVLSMPDTDDWSAGRIAALKRASLYAVEPIGMLSIASLDLEIPLFTDTSRFALDVGVGLIEGTSQPGGFGNVGIAGHRDGFFRKLRFIFVGDQISVRTKGEQVVYAVTQTSIVSPRDTNVLAPTAKPSLTLVTCYPFYFVGAAPQRFIVRAEKIAAGID